ncbi:hypothetical protein DPEC_G00307620 [Dallia pectoralis]|uniref:Uncharacterized protein n=1 Tax=Dallia pectoralis TaxID=75939 RepID=A0ACC2FE96_DALPE|nr:hypothetical protein DPEC_G00307620 [Dallia pectoralis]
MFDFNKNVVLNILMATTVLLPSEQKQFQYAFLPALFSRYIHLVQQEMVPTGLLCRTFFLTNVSV